LVLLEETGRFDDELIIRPSSLLNVEFLVVLEKEGFSERSL
jgi:hypothetical protein